MLHLQVQGKYFHAIRAGLKRVEGRLGKEKYLSLSQGDRICFTLSHLSPENSTSEETARSYQPPMFMQHICKVVKVVHYSSFREMLEQEGLEAVLPEERTIEEGVAIYRHFYTKRDELRHGVVAIHLST